MPLVYEKESLRGSWESCGLWQVHTVACDYFFPGILELKPEGTEGQKQVLLAYQGRARKGSQTLELPQ